MVTMPESYNGYVCPNPKCKELFLEGLYSGAVRIKCQACGHTVEFVGERKPRCVDLGISPAPDNSFEVRRCADCGRRLCDHKGGGWFVVKCSLCRNYNVIDGGAVTSIGRDTDREKMSWNK